MRITLGDLVFSPHDLLHEQLLEHESGWLPHRVLRSATCVFDRLDGGTECSQRDISPNPDGEKYV